MKTAGHYEGTDSGRYFPPNDLKTHGSRPIIAGNG